MAHHRVSGDHELGFRAAGVDLRERVRGRLERNQLAMSTWKLALDAVATSVCPRWQEKGPAIKNGRPLKNAKGAVGYRPNSSPNR